VRQQRPRFRSGLVVPGGGASCFAEFAVTNARPHSLDHARFLRNAPIGVYLVAIFSSLKPHLEWWAGFPGRVLFAEELPSAKATPRDVPEFPDLPVASDRKIFRMSHGRAFRTAMAALTRPLLSRLEAFSYPALWGHVAEWLRNGLQNRLWLSLYILRGPNKC
jgi:hypothetical protein